jgi:predicted SnoaL-like aldol condensation-catalyzing enzyme
MKSPCVHTTQEEIDKKVVLAFYEAGLNPSRPESPRSHSETKRVFVDGDFVILHVHKIVEPGTLGVAIIDIFRVDDGKIVEHWDVTQAIPERTVSGNPMV